MAMACPNSRQSFKSVFNIPKEYARKKLEQRTQRLIADAQAILEQHRIELEQHLLDKGQLAAQQVLQNPLTSAHKSLTYLLPGELELAQSQKRLAAALNKLDTRLNLGHTLTKPSAMGLPEQLTQAVKEQCMTLSLCGLAERQCNAAANHLLQQAIYPLLPPFSRSLFKNGASKIKLGTYLLKSIGSTYVQQTHRCSEELSNRIAGLMERWLFHIFSHWKVQIIAGIYKYHDQMVKEL